MEETKQANEEKQEKHEGKMAPIHRVCEACNNMFEVPADSPQRRCPHCRKE